jgi:hypothetical protein
MSSQRRASHPSPLKSMTPCITSSAHLSTHQVHHGKLVVELTVKTVPAAAISTASRTPYNFVRQTKSLRYQGKGSQ